MQRPDDHSIAEPLDLGRGGRFLHQEQVRFAQPSNEPASQAHASATAWLHVLQYQPTDRPIEDRYSIDLRPCAAASRDGDQVSRLLLAVYDGHRGSSAADHASKALPTEILSTIASLTGDEKHKNDRIQSCFERFDEELLSSFQEAHPVASETASRRHLPGLAKLLPNLIRDLRHKNDPSQGAAAGLQAENTPGALRVLSGCTVAMLVLELPSAASEATSATIINLGDSRVVVSALRRGEGLLATSTDINSSTRSEQDLIESQHPLDNPTDLFVGGRLFGDTFSTRAIGDGIYKLPIRKSTRQEGGERTATYRALTDAERSQHRHLIAQLSRHQQRLRVTSGKGKVIPLIERYNALFSAYNSPPYVSAMPDVVNVPLAGSYSTKDDSTAEEGQLVLAILATDGLWDLIKSEEAVAIVDKHLKSNGSDTVSRDENLAQVLYNAATMNAGRRAGDDVSICVMILKLPKHNS